jgi:hypothetical protein
MGVIIAWSVHHGNEARNGEWQQSIDFETGIQLTS